MITFDRVIILIILVWTFIYTISYGKWIWKKKNILGAIMVFLLAVTILVLPIYSIFFRDG